VVQDLTGTHSSTPTLVRHTGQQRLVGVGDDIRMSVHPLQQHGRTNIAVLVYQRLCLCSLLLWGKTVILVYLQFYAYAESV
jgi:hypothetical protein